MNEKKMATCLKRSGIRSTAIFNKNKQTFSSTTSSSSSSTSSSSSSSSSGIRSLGLGELLCPVCRSLLREPVTLPCGHNLCLICLRGSVEHSSLSCPLCRKRVGSWLRTATRTENLVNQQLWQFIRDNYKRELLELASCNEIDASDQQELILDVFHLHDDGFNVKKSISADGEIRKEYELQLKLQEEEMRRQRERERLASEAYIKKLQEEEEQKTMLQLAQDQLLAKTLAKQDLYEKTNNRYERSAKSAAISYANKLNNQLKPTSQKLSKTKEALDLKKQSTAPTSKAKSERYTLNAKNLTTVQKESFETVSSQKPVPIHNAVTRVVTHQSKLSQPNNSFCSAAPDEFIGSSSKIYGQRSEEELHVPNDVLSNKKKKLDVEVCITTGNVEDEERIGSAESAGSHDSMNQEFHHFKPIKALPRTPFRTLDGKQIDPKLIRVLPILKRISNVVPKPPSPTHTKKVFGCTWSAFKRIAKQHLLLKDSLSQLQLTDIKKTDRKSEQQSSRSISSKTIMSDLEERDSVDGGSVVAFDSNKNYTKAVGGSRVLNGAKLCKNDQNANSTKQSNKRAKPRNGQLSSSHKKKLSESEKEIEVVQIDDDDDVNMNAKETNGTKQDQQSTPDPLAPSPNKVNEASIRPPSSLFEFAAIENIAERIKRRKTSRTGNTENLQAVMNSAKSVDRVTKAKSKKPSTKGRKQKTKKAEEVALSKSTKTKKKKIVVTTSVTSHIKKLAAKSAKRPRYTEDSESEEEPVENQIPAVKATTVIEKPPVPPPAPSPPQPVKQPSEPETVQKQSIVRVPSPSPRKRPRKNARPMPRKQRKLVSPLLLDNSTIIEDKEALIKEQERLERLAEQERRDREMAQQLQARFDAMERIAGRTRRGIARLPASPPLVDIVIEQPQRPPQKRPAVK